MGSAPPDPLGRFFEVREGGIRDGRIGVRKGRGR